MKRRKLMMELSQSRLRELFSYDSSTGKFLYKIRKGFVGRVAGSLRRTGYNSLNVDGELWQAHRLAWLYVYGYLPYEKIDHINGVRDDNRIENLRMASNADNLANSKRSAANKTGFKGVSFSKTKGRYRASIVRHGKQHFLGYFDSAKEAHESYCGAAKRLFGEFARAA